MKVKVNDAYDFEIDLDGGTLKVNQQELNIDSRRLSERHAHIIYQNGSYNLELVEENKSEKIALVKVNGREYRIAMEDRYDQLLKQLGMDNLKANVVSELKAPMPGLVLNVMVKEGQEVQKGDSLIVLEAMKMENVIKSPTGGLIKQVLVQRGDKVEKNELLIQFA